MIYNTPIRDSVMPGFSRTTIGLWWCACSAGKTGDQPHEADAEDRADEGEAAWVVGVGLGKDVRRCQVEQHAREKPEVEPEDLVRDG